MSTALYLFKPTNASYSFLIASYVMAIHVQKLQQMGSGSKVKL